MWLTTGDGKQIARIVGRVFIKDIDPDLHMLKRPPAICIDREVWVTWRSAVDMIVCNIKGNPGEQYRVTADRFDARAELLNRKHGDQLMLRLDQWTHIDPRQVTLF